MCANLTDQIFIEFRQLLMSPFLALNDVGMKVLVLEVRVTRDEVSFLPENVQQWLLSLKFPIFENSGHLIQSVSSRGLVQTLRNAGFTFAPSYEQLKALEQVRVPANLSFAIVMNACVAAIVNRDFSLINVLLTSLNKLIEVGENIELVTSMFYHCVLEFLKSRPGNVMDCAVPLVYFVMEREDLPMEAFSLFFDMFKLLHEPSWMEIGEDAAVFLGMYAETVSNLHVLGRTFPQQVTLNILNALKEALLCFDCNAVTFLKSFRFEFTKDYFELVCRGLFEYLKGRDQVMIKKLATRTKVTPLEFKNPIPCDLENTFPGGLDVAHSPMIPEPQNLLVILNQDTKLVSALVELKEILSQDERCCQQFLAQFGSTVSSESKSYCAYDLIAVYLFLFSEHDKRDMSFLRDALFTPEFTVFDDDIDFQDLNTLRAVALNVVMKTDAKRTLKFIYDLVPFPLLYAEMVLRLSSLAEVIPGNVEEYVKLLLDPFLLYRGFIGNDKVVAARTSIVIFINHVFQVKEIRSMFLTNEDFLKGFLEMANEKQLLPQFLDVIRNFLTNPRQFSVRPLLLATQPLFNSYRLDLALPLLRVYTQILSLHKQRDALVELIPCMCHCLSTAEKGFLYNAYVDEIVSFLAEATTGETDLSQKDLANLQQALVHVYKNGIDGKLMVRLRMLMAKQLVATSQFVIAKPEVFRMTLKVCLKTDLSKSILADLLDTITYSAANAVSLRRSGIDHTILHFLDKWQHELVLQPKRLTTKHSPLREKVMNDHSQEHENRQTSNGEESKITQAMEILLNMLSEMYRHDASITSGYRLLSLLRPIDGQMTPFHEPVLNMFSQLYQDRYRLPQYPMEITNSKPVVVQNIPTSVLNNEFSFHLWICVLAEDTKSKTQLFCVTGMTSFVRLRLEGAVLVIDVQSPARKARKQFDLSSLRGQWIFLSVYYGRNVTDGFNYCSVFVNGESFAEAKGYPDVSFRFPRVELYKCVSNGIQPNRIGPQMLFAGLSTSEFTSLFDIGARNISALQRMNPVFCFVPAWNEGEFCLMPYHSDSSIIAVCPKLTLWTGALPDVFSDATLLIPLFKYINGSEHMPFPAEIYLVVLSQMFETSRVAQDSFLDACGFEALAHLLMRQNRIITFHLYNRFCSLEEVIVIPELYESLFSSILMNIRIWTRADAGSQNRIFRHWQSVLYPSHSSLFDKLIGTKRLIFSSIHDVSLEKDVIPLVCGVLEKLSFSVGDIDFLVASILNSSGVLKVNLFRVLVRVCVGDSGIQKIMCLLSDDEIHDEVANYLHGEDYSLPSRPYKFDMSFLAVAKEEMRLLAKEFTTYSRNWKELQQSQAGFGWPMKKPHKRDSIFSSFFSPLRLAVSVFIDSHERMPQCVTLEVSGVLYSSFKQENVIIRVHPVCLSLETEKKSVRVLNYASLKYTFIYGTVLCVVTDKGLMQIVDLVTEENMKNLLRNTQGKLSVSAKEEILNDMRKLWKSRALTNSEFISAVNFLRGRSFETFDNYPTLPNVIDRFENGSFVFRDPATVSRDRLTPHQIECFFLGTKSDLSKEYPEFPLDLIFIPEIISFNNSKPTKEGHSEPATPKRDQQKCILPQWADSIYEFSYLLRRSIDSDEATPYISAWLELSDTPAPDTQIITIERAELSKTDTKGPLRIPGYGIVNLFHKSVANLSMNQSLDLAVASTDEGELVFVSLSRRIPMKFVKLDEKVLTCHVTNSGMVVIACQSPTISLFTMSGSLIKKVEVECSPVKFASRRVNGREFVFAATEEGELWAFEAFYPESMSKIGTVQDKVSLCVNNHEINVM